MQCRLQVSPKRNAGWYLSSQNLFDTSDQVVSVCATQLPSPSYPSSMWDDVSGTSWATWRGETFPPFGSGLRAGPGRAEPAGAGPSRPSRARPSRAGVSRSRPDRAEPNPSQETSRAEPSEAGPSRRAPTQNSRGNEKKLKVQVKRPCGGGKLFSILGLASRRSRIDSNQA